MLLIDENSRRQQDDSSNLDEFLDIKLPSLALLNEGDSRNKPLDGKQSLGAKSTVVGSAFKHECLSPEAMI